jgi:hypothetical protein
MNPFTHLARLLGRGGGGYRISPSQGLYLHRTAQHRKTRTSTHASSEIRTHDLTVREIMAHALPLWSANCSLLLTIFKTISNWYICVSDIHRFGKWLKYTFKFCVIYTFGEKFDIILISRFFLHKTSGQKFFLDTCRQRPMVIYMTTLMSVSHSLTGWWGR